MTRRNNTSRRVQRPTDALAVVLVHRLEALDLVVDVRLAHGSASSLLKRREMPLDLGRAHLGERRRPPARPVVLVDDHGAHALVEIVAFDDARHYAEFGAHARLRNRSVLPRRTCASAILRLSGDLVRMVAAVCPAHAASAEPDDASRSSAARISSTRVAGEQPVDGRAARRDRPLARAGSWKAASTASTGTRAGKALEQRRKTRRRHAVRGDAGGDARRRRRSARRSRPQ